MSWRVQGTARDDRSDFVGPFMAPRALGSRLGHRHGGRRTTLMLCVEMGCKVECVLKGVTAGHESDHGCSCRARVVTAAVVTRGRTVASPQVMTAIALATRGSAVCYATAHFREHHELRRRLLQLRCVCCITTKPRAKRRGPRVLRTILLVQRTTN